MNSAQKKEPNAEGGEPGLSDPEGIWYPQQVPDPRTHRILSESLCGSRGSLLFESGLPARGHVISPARVYRLTYDPHVCG